MYVVSLVFLCGEEAGYGQLLVLLVLGFVGAVRVIVRVLGGSSLFRRYFDVSFMKGRNVVKALRGDFGLK